jgi:hypothetical protein
MEELHLNAADMDYRELLAEAMRLEGSYEILRMNQVRRQQGGQLTAHQNLMMLQHPTGAPASGGATPMEIGNVNRSQTNTTQRPKGDQRGRPSGPVSSRPYRGGRPGQGQTAQRGTTPHQYGGRPEPPRSQNYSNPPRQPSTSTAQQGSHGRVDPATLHPSQCLSCYGHGHWSYECPSKKKQEDRQNRFGQRSTGRGRGTSVRGQAQRGRGFGARSQVHNIEDGATSDTKN